MSPVPEVNQPDPADKAECSSGSDLTEESINLQDFVVVPSQISSPGSSTDSPENEVSLYRQIFVNFPGTWHTRFSIFF